MFLYANGAFSKEAGVGGKVRRNPQLRLNGVLSYVRQARADHSLSSCTREDEATVVGGRVRGLGGLAMY